MTSDTGSNDKKDMPKTWSADHGGGVAVPSKVERDPADSGEGNDQGIKPQDLTTENDQGAT